MILALLRVSFKSRLLEVWRFPLRETSNTRVPQDSFLANNVTFRRYVALANPFVPLAGNSRRACRSFAGTCKTPKRMGWDLTNFTEPL